MFQSRTVKIALAVFLVVVLALAAYFYFGRNKQEDSPADDTRTIGNDEEPSGGSLPANTGGGGSTGVSTTTTALPGVSPTITPPPASATITPYPGSGAFDYTRTSPRVDLQPILEEGLTVDQLKKVQQNDICGLADISTSWNSPVEKILCSFLEYTTFKVFDPLNDFICNLITASLKTNFDEGIESKIIDGRCQIEDRK